MSQSKQRYYYKVVTPYNGKLMSALHTSLVNLYIPNTNISVEYKLHQYVYPTIKNSGLCVFKTLNDAKRFAHAHQDIYLCEVVGIFRKPLITLLSEIINMWKLREQHKTFSYLTDGGYLRGTVMVKGVKLLSKIED